MFYRDDARREAAEAYVAELEDAKIFGKPIVTEITPLQTFYPAEGYHQDYVAHHPAYVVAYDLPKLEPLRRAYADLYKERTSH